MTGLLIFIALGLLKIAYELYLKSKTELRRGDKYFPILFERAFSPLANEILEINDTLSVIQSGEVDFGDKNIVFSGYRNQTDFYKYNFHMVSSKCEVDHSMININNHLLTVYTRITFRNDLIMSWQLAYPEEMENPSYKRNITFAQFIKPGFIIIGHPAQVEKIDESEMQKVKDFLDTHDMNDQSYIYTLENGDVLVTACDSLTGLVSIYCGRNSFKEVCQIIIDYNIINWKQHLA